MAGPRGPDAVEAQEIARLLQEVYAAYGYDFRQYAYASIRRRILRSVETEGAPGVEALRERILGDEPAMERFLLSLTVHVTSMFRDPGFYASFRSRVVPLLATYPYVRIWVAGCSTGEELYSLAILLEEEGLGERCRMYATDLSDEVVRRAKRGVFPLAAMREYTDNYQRSGGTRDFSHYYTARGDAAAFRASLRRNVVFAQHSLVTDGAPNEFHAVVCRNVLIYFNQALQDRVHRLFYDNLVRLGFLCLGRKESLQFTPNADRYEAVDAEEKIWRKVR